ncbi:MAG: hypothetical protein PHR52_11000 [Fermentimonas sp.]|nr:hypothetical protein [Fermentimonas sp.]
MMKINIQDAVYKVPASWNEMTKTQFMFLVKLSSRENLTYVEIQLKFFLHCIRGTVSKDIGNGLFVIKTKQGRHPLFADELTAVLEVFDYLFEINDDNIRSIAPKITINHFKHVKSRGKSLRGPGDALEDITYEQFVWLQTWQSQLNADPDAINQLINVLYTSSDEKHEVRTVRRMRKSVKAAILWYIQGTMSFIQLQFPHVFKPSGDDSNINVFDYQQRVIDSLAEGDVTKKNQVRQSLLYDALYSMEMAAIRIENYEKESKKHKK